MRWPGVSWRGMAMAAIVAWCGARAAQLPLRRYTTADGLANNRINQIVSDRRGFLWFATAEGLSRFDGYAFTNESGSTGLPHRAVTRLLIDRRDNFWLGTPAGLVRFRPERPRGSAGRMTVLHLGDGRSVNEISALLEDSLGRIWCGTSAGVFMAGPSAGDGAPFSEIPLGMPAGWGSLAEALVEDRYGTVWVGAADGVLYRHLRDGRVDRYQVAENANAPLITDLLADRRGQIWIATESGLYRTSDRAGPAAISFERVSGRPGEPPDARFHALFEAREGDVWAASATALAEFPNGGGPTQLWKGNYGLPVAHAQISALGQDRDGNLWLGAEDLGALKVAAGGLQTYSTGDGLGSDSVISLGETLAGDLFAASLDNRGVLFVNTLAGERFTAVRPRVPKEITYFGWRFAHMILQDHTGEWWVAGEGGLCRYPPLEGPAQLARVAPKACYTVRDGLPGRKLVRLYEDRSGNIWIATELHDWSIPEPHVVCWNRSQERFVQSTPDGAKTVSVFGEDGAGNVWIGDENGRLWRLRDGGFSPVEGVPNQGWINSILSDRTGRLWVATSAGGLLRFDRPTAAHPQFRRYGMEDGLSSTRLFSLAEGRNGSVYVGTGSGVDRLDPEQSRVWHYTAADGLAPGDVRAIHRDRNGTMWFGTMHGLTRMSAEDLRSSASAAPIWITGISVAGQAAALSGLGERNVRQLDIRPGQEHIQFDFVGLSFVPGNVLRYQYRLGEEGWSAPIEARSVHYGALAPGRYRFAVRAVNSDGIASPEPATVEFDVAQPLWRQAWFQALFIAAALGGAVLVHRGRVSRLLAVQRVRMRIATDLHDDIGSSLSQIAVLSDVAQHRLRRGEAGEPLARIGGLSRELLDSISDIVWAIQPHKDRLSDLQQRMRRFASEVLSARNIELHWPADGTERDVELNAERRRQVYLIFKEAIHNAARHSGATKVRVGLRTVGRRLDLEVNDNGCGIDSDREHGNGLKNMKLRAAKLGAGLEVRSQPGEGTTVRLQMAI